MCGIAGYWGSGGRNVLERMGDSLTHRGPDEGGIIECGPVGLAHRRLSIIDLSPTGHQPMENNGGTVALVFNGEIYNHQKLRQKYLSGYCFRGTSDTEVILHLYNKLGEACFKELSGMFAIALYDRAHNKLILARDRIGKKPLYWTRVGDTLIFGSELKALRAHPVCPHTLSHTAIAQYLMYEYVSAPWTIYENVHKVLPGTYLVYNGKTITENVYTDLAPTQGTYTGNFEEAQQELLTLLDTAVQKRMVADVPVGVFLSGGLDSSTIAYFAQKAAGTPVNTFSIGFTDLSFDESGYARAVAEHLGTKHHERIVGPRDLLSIIDHLPQILDEPMADSSIIPTAILSEFTKGEVKVVLGGDGADELFFGYDTFFAHRMGMWFEHLPTVFHQGMRSFAEMLPVSHAYMSFDFKVKKFLSGFDTTRARRNTYWLSACTPEEIRLLLTYPIDTDVLFHPSDRYYVVGETFWDALQREYVKGYLSEDILVKTDRAGMAHGLEVRAPFLDTHIVQFALTLDSSFKRKGRTGKYLLREAMRGKIPNTCIDRSKKGFNIPIGHWIRYELKDFFVERLLDGHLISSGLFNREQLAILLQAHLDGRADNRKKLWTLMTLELWMHTWYGHKS